MDERTQKLSGPELEIMSRARERAKGATGCKDWKVQLLENNQIRYSLKLGTIDVHVEPHDKHGQCYHGLVMGRNENVRVTPPRGKSTRDAKEALELTYKAAIKALRYDLQQLDGPPEAVANPWD